MAAPETLSNSRAEATVSSGLEWPEALKHRFRIIAFDWDGTAVTDSHEDTSQLCLVVDRLLRAGVVLAVLTAMTMQELNRQLIARISGVHKRRLYVLANNGSEVCGFDALGQRVVLWSQIATPEQEQALTEIASAVRDELAARTGLDLQVLYNRQNRRQVDLLPEPEWRDLPRSRVGEVQSSVEQRLRNGGLAGGLEEAFQLAQRIARARLPGARVNTDGRLLEIGLTDKADSIDWLIRHPAAENRVPVEDILVVGNEFGLFSGVAGSDSRIGTASARGAVYASVGAEPQREAPDVIVLEGGPSCFRRLLEFQAMLNERLVVHPRTARSPLLREPVSLPGITLEPTADPDWCFVEEGFLLDREHEFESLFSVGNGYVGSRGSLAEGSPMSLGATFVAGAFELDPSSGLAAGLAVGPDWMRLRSLPGGVQPEAMLNESLEHYRTLDLRQGMLWRHWRIRDRDGRIGIIRGLRLASLADRHLLVQVVLLTPENFSSLERLECVFEQPPRGRSRFLFGVRNGCGFAQSTSLSGVTIAFASIATVFDDAGQVLPRSLTSSDQQLSEHWDFEVGLGKTYKLIRLVSVFTSRDGPAPADQALEHLARIAPKKPELLSAHVSAWRERWDAADVSVDGDHEATRALRFAAYHLTSSANPDDEHVSIAARGLSGGSYLGHVFWDTEIFMLPFLTFTYPLAARALLMYRFHTLPAARTKASSFGYRGALYAWESAHTGAESTPRYMLLPDGEVAPVLNGDQEHHISAAIAYAVWQYWQATGDEEFLLEAGAEILLETARFWASRTDLSPHGERHIRRVIGPDEYHESVDDNAYTNGMARWNLEVAADLTTLLAQRWPDHWQELASRLHMESEEPASWSRCARELVTGFNEQTGLFEQFSGYFQLADLDVSRVVGQPAPPELLLGRQRIKQSKVAKQADVVMLMFLLRDRFRLDVIDANFRYYEPRTVHGSSLSPPVHALMAARLGDLELAHGYFQQTAAIDLSNSFGNAAGGVHMAALGGLWQAAVLGFAGLDLQSDGLSFAPHLPAQWRALRFAVQWRGRKLQLVVRSNEVEVQLEGSAPMTLALEQGPQSRLEPGRHYTAARGDTRWRPT